MYLSRHLCMHPMTHMCNNVNETYHISHVTRVMSHAESAGDATIRICQVALCMSQVTLDYHAYMSHNTHLQLSHVI